MNLDLSSVKVNCIYNDTGPEGALVFPGGYHPRKGTFKTHPKHVFSKNENTP